jgi:hypothetical protein
MGIALDMGRASGALCRAANQLDDVAAAFVRDVRLFHPDLVVIMRYRTPALMGSGLAKPGAVVDKEHRSAIWGKLLVISETGSVDDMLIQARTALKPYVGWWANFLNVSPVNGGLVGCPWIQSLGVMDVHKVVEEDVFFDRIAPDLQ